MDILDALTREIERIVVTSPYYPVALKHLHEILLQDVKTHAAVRTWGACCPPQDLDALAELVRDAVDNWPYALQILEQLTYSVEFRDSYIRLAPSSLNSLLQTALKPSNTDDFRNYSKLCTAFLSEPLPNDFGLPAVAQTFLVRAVENATKSPDTRNLLQVYQLLNGACSDIPRVLPPKIVARFDDQMTCVLNSLQSTEHHFAKALCLGILKALSKPSSFEQEYAFLSPEKCTNYFSGSKSLKTIQLVVLLVTWVCRDEYSKNQDALEMVTVATEILVSVEPTRRYSWTQCNKVFFSKLIEKVLRPEIDPELQREGLAFIGLLIENAPPKNLVTAFEQVFSVDSPALFRNSRRLGRTSSLSLQTYGPHADPDFTSKTIGRLLEGVTGAAFVSPMWVALRKVADSLVGVIPQLLSLRKQILGALDTEEIRPLVQQYTRLPWADAGICRTNYCRYQLQLSVTSLLLVAGCHTPSPEEQLPSALTTGLIEKLRYAASEHCMNRPHAMGPRNVQSPFFTGEQAATFDLSRGQGWREQLAKHLEAEASQKQQNLVRAVGKIVNDLEERCNMVEGPLRQAERAAEELQGRLDEANARIAQLQACELDRSLVLDAVEEEKRSLEETIQTVEAKNTWLEASAKKLERRLTESKSLADRSLYETKEAYRAHEFELRTLLASKEEAYQNLSDSVHSIREKSERLQQELHDVGQRAQNMEMHRNTLQDEANKLGIELSESRTSEFAKDALISDMKDELGSTTSKLNKALARAGELASDHEEFRRISENQAEMLRLKHGKEMEQTVSETTEHRRNLEQQIESANEQAQRFQLAQEKIAEELMQTKNEKTVLEDDVSRLAAECAEKEAEIEEFQHLRENLTAMLRFQTPEAKPSKRSAKTATKIKEQIAMASSKRLDQQISTERSFDTPERKEKGEITTSHSSPHSGPTPKRTKPRKSFRVPLAQRSRTSAGAGIEIRSKTSTARQPLMDLSAERANQTPVRRPRQSFDCARRSHPFELIQRRKSALPAEAAVSFESDFFSSTPLTQRPARIADEDEFYDETTVEM